MLFFLNDTAPTEIYTLSLHDALPISSSRWVMRAYRPSVVRPPWRSRSSWPLRVSLTDSIHRRIQPMGPWRDRKHTPLNSSPRAISDAVFFVLHKHHRCRTLPVL